MGIHQQKAACVVMERSTGHSLTSVKMPAFFPGSPISAGVLWCTISTAPCSHLQELKSNNKVEDNVIDDRI